MTLDNLRLLTETLIPLVGNVGDLISKIEKGIVTTTATTELRNILGIALDRVARAKEGDSARDKASDERVLKEQHDASVTAQLARADEPTKP